MWSDWLFWVIFLPLAPALVWLGLLLTWAVLSALLVLVLTAGCFWAALGSRLFSRSKRPFLDHFERFFDPTFKRLYPLMIFRLDE